MPVRRLLFNRTIGYKYYYVINIYLQWHSDFFISYSFCNWSICFCDFSKNPETFEKAWFCNATVMAGFRDRVFHHKPLSWTCGELFVSAILRVLVHIFYNYCRQIPTWNIFLCVTHLYAGLSTEKRVRARNIIFIRELYCPYGRKKKSWNRMSIVLRHAVRSQRYVMAVCFRITYESVHVELW